MVELLAINGGDAAIQGELPVWPVRGAREEEALLGVLRSGRWGRLEGESVVARFEQRFAKAHDCEYGIACSSGTIALKLALMAIGIQPGDEVIVPPFTFMATATAVLEVNAAPIFVDIEPDTYCIDPAAIERAITPRTRAIIPVHLAGQPADMDAIMELANRHGLYVIEDACHAHGAKYKGRAAGSIGHIGCFSFQASKNMSAGEGGIMITNDKALAEMMFSLHNCGREPGQPWYRHFRLGGNHRLGEFQGAILDCQLDQLEEWCERRTANARALAARINRIEGLATQPIERAEVTRHAFHLLVIRYDEQAWGFPRELFIEAAQAEGLPLAAGYPIALFRQPLFENREFGPYQGYRALAPELDLTAVDCPVADKASQSEAMWIHQKNLLGTPELTEAFATAFEKLDAGRNQLRGIAAQKARA